MRCCGSLGILMDWDWTEKWLPLPTVLCVIIIGSHRKHLLLMLKEFVWVTAVTLTSCCVFISLFVRWSHMKVSLHLISEGSQAFLAAAHAAENEKVSFFSSSLSTVSPFYHTGAMLLHTRQSTSWDLVRISWTLCKNISTFHTAIKVKTTRSHLGTERPT